MDRTRYPIGRGRDATRRACVRRIVVAGWVVGGARLHLCDARLARMVLGRVGLFRGGVGVICDMGF